MGACYLKMSYASIASVVCYCLVFVSIILNCANAFNVETKNFVRHTGQSHSMFGFSVTLHQNDRDSWVIIGAPQAQTVQPGVTRGGAVYRCGVFSDDSCQELPFDTTGNTNNTSGIQVDKKSGQWLGATVNSAGINGPIVACAPRYTYFSKNINRRDPVGNCFVAKGDFSEYIEYSPCRTNAWGYHRQGSCQAGLGAAMAKDGSRVYIGAPGSWYWQGQIYSVKPSIRLPFVPPKHKEYGEGQIFSQNLHNSGSSTKNVYSSPEGPAVDDDSYMGYSVTSGDFTGDGKDGVAVGMPRGSGLYGKVILYSWDLINYQNITGEQLGAYFGYAITVADVDGDGYDDLIVGAPLFTEFGNNEGKYETGRVYVIYQRSNKGLYTRHHRLDGLNSKARFGLSVAYIGDINLDSYDDFAVGAPYDGENGNGAVYIYHGSSKGVLEKASQVIFAEDLHDEPLRTFGFSIGGGVDLDNNEYPDMVVGAYESNKAIFLRSRPVVKIKATILFLAENKQIRLDQTNCTLKNGKKVPCADIEVCFQFDGIGVDDFIYIHNEYVLDSKKLKNPRMFFINTPKNNILNDSFTVKKGDKFCKRETVYINENLRDKLTPLEAEMKISMIDQSERYALQRRSGRSVLYPILDHDAGLIQRDSITIQKNCGRDNICIPNLRLIANPNVNRYLLGSKALLKIDVDVQNEGEDAFEATYTLKIPPGINFINIERKDAAQSEIPVQCSAPTAASNNTLKCDIGNPLPTEKLVRFTVLLEPFYEPGMKPNYDFIMDVNSTNPENGTLNDNHIETSVLIWVKTDFTIDGSSKPQEELYFNASQYDSENATQESEIGPQIVHIYSVRNNGPSNIDEAEVFFAWPMETLGGDTLMYMLDEPETYGPIYCEYINEINALNLKLERRKSFLESFGVTTTGSEWTKGFAPRHGYRYEESYSKTHQTGSRVTSGHEANMIGGRGGDKHKVISTTFEKKVYDEDENGEESGDGSDIHSKRIKETIETQTGGTGNGHRISVIGAEGSKDSNEGLKTTKTEHHYVTSWNSSSINGGPAQTYSWNRSSTSVTGADGVTRYNESYSGSDGSVFGAGSGGIGDSIFYTSSRGGGSQSIQSGSSSHSGGTHFSQSGGSEQNSNRDYSVTGSHSIQGGGVNQGGSSGHTSERKEWSTHSEHHTDGSQNRLPNIPIGGDGNIKVTVQQSHTGHSSDGSHWGSSGEKIARPAGTRFEEESHSSHTVHIPGGERHISEERHHVHSKDDNIHGAQSSGTHHSVSGTHHSVSGTQYPPMVTHTSREYVSGGGYGENVHKHTIHGGQSGHRTETSGSTQWGHESGHTDQGRDGADGQYDSNSSRQYFSWSSGGRNNEENDGGSHDTEYPQWSHEETVHTDIGGGISGGPLDFDYRDKSHSGGSQEEGGLITTYASRNGSSGGEAKIYNIGRNRSTYGQYDKKNYDQTLGIGNAAVGGGLRTVTLNLGQLGNTNSNQEGEHSSSHVETRYGGGHVGGGHVEGGHVGGGHVGGGHVGGHVGGGHGGRHVEGGHSVGGGQVGGTRQQGGSTRYGTSYSSGERAYESRPAGYDPDLGYSRTYQHEYTSGGGETGDNTRHESSSSGGWSQTYSSSGGSSSSKHYGSEGHHETGQTFNSGERGRGRNDGYGERHYESHSYSSSGDTFTEDPQNIDNQFSHYKKFKRQVQKSKSDMQIEKALECKATHCAIMKCIVKNLDKNHPEAWVAFRARMNATTVKKISGNKPLTVSSMMVARISKLPYIGKPIEQQVKSHEVFTKVIPKEIDQKADIVPLWVVVLSAVAGTIILLLLIYLLYKCGFFKRNRPTDTPERQPLNRNGYYQNGDEQL